MAKVSRPVIYAVVAAAVVYVIVLYTEPAKPPKKVTKRSTVGAASAAPQGFLPEDMTAHFAAYQSKGAPKDAFRPGISAKRPQTNALPSGPKLGGLFSPLGTRGSWTLTGVNVINGKRSALIENPLSGDSMFLKVGDLWNGLQVAAIESDTVVFVNSLGQHTELKFMDPADDSTTTPTLGGPGQRPVVTVTPMNPNGVSVAPGGVAPVVPALPAPSGIANGVNVPINGRQIR